MKRKELFEFEDFTWFPSVIRTGMTNLILVLHKMMGTTEVLSNLIVDLRKKHNFNTVVDLGSGSGGPMPNVIKSINKKTPNNTLRLILSDLHPNVGLVEKINSDEDTVINYHQDPVNAINLPDAPKGLKTMVASFHHMSPTTAKQILKSASESQQPILIYEIAKNNIPFLIWLLLLPFSLSLLIIMSLVMTLFVKGLTITQIVFTYIIPIIPIAYAWDGQASLIRTYTFEDIDLLLADNKNKDYSWVMNEAIKSNGKKLGYYVMGYPK